MRSKLFKALLFVVACLLSLFSVSASANTFAGGIPQSIPFTYNGVTYDRYIVISRTDYNICSNTIALYFNSSEMTAAGYPSSNQFSLVLTYPGNIPAFNTIPDGTHMAIFSAANVNGVCSWTSNAFEGVTTVPQGAYTLYADKSMAIHDHNFDLYAKDYVPSWGTLPHTFDSGYESWGTWEQNGLVQLGSPFNMKLPLPGGKNWKLNTQIGGAIECNGGTDQFHTGSNFYSLDFGHYSQENGDESDIPILAVAPGEVNQNLTGWSNSYGNTVVIDHFGGYRTRYAHMASPSLVTSGHVNQGDQLGVMGTTPGGIYSSGVHLHLQIYYNGSSAQSIPELTNVTMENKNLSDYLVGCHKYYYSGNYPLP